LASNGALAKRQLTAGSMNLVKTNTGSKQSLEPGHLRQSIEQAKNYHSQLVIVIGESASQLVEHTASSDGLAKINLGLELSEKLLEIPGQDRARSALALFSHLLKEQQTGVLLLNHIEILFDRTLSIDPLKLLQSCAKNLTLVVAWPGEKTTSSLTYAAPSHPEYRSYKASDFGETIFVEADKTDI